MRKTIQTLTLVAMLATVGEFLIEFRGFMSEGSHQEPKQETTQEPQTSVQDHCNVELYKPAIERERKRYNDGSIAEQDVPLKLGEDYSYRYFYDYRLDEAFCRPIEGPKAKRIFGSEPREEPMDDIVLFWATLVAAVSAAGLVLIQFFRR
jgi:hypothetical protein